jgi:quinol-cytochrome oxidoreductase complex cytochrome b subunit/coenzyme F420-reducing hydrogenase delta subunit
MPDSGIFSPPRSQADTNLLQRGLRRGFLYLEAGLDKCFGAAWNPLYQLGALGFFYYWVVAVSGIYIYIFFDTGTAAAYESVEYMTEEQWYLAGVMRSLHRYASDGMVLMMLVHALREYALGHLKGPRWFTWVTGVPVLWLVVIAGISGYWLVWDQLAQYVAIATAEWLDWWAIFGDPIARNFISPAALDDRFFTLLLFVHIMVPLLLLLVLWIHLQRISHLQINPNRGLAAGTFVMLLVLSLMVPAVSHGPADLARVPVAVNLDWFYLWAYPLMDLTSEGAVWSLAGVLTIMLAVLPWLPPRVRRQPAEVSLSNCNGCGRCAADCPYSAILMRPRSDGLPFDTEAVVTPALCVSCGICAGACPTSTPFRRKSDLIPGIDLIDAPLRDLRARIELLSGELSEGPRVLLFGCEHGAALETFSGKGVAVVVLPCIAALPPSFIDYVLSRDLAEGVLLTGCRKGDCYNRHGIDWTEARLAGTRDPYLRTRVPRECIEVLWAADSDRADLLESLEAFRRRLSVQEKTKEPPRPKVESHV